MQSAEDTDRFHVVTGGPGSGKTALINSLERLGYCRSLEAGRGVIQDQVSIGGHALPWDDQVLFSELMLCWEMRSYRMAQNSSGPVFFDRGVVDVLGYLRLIGHEFPEHMRQAAKTFRYNHCVFIAPPWEEIFRNDRERKQDYDEAVRTYDALAAAYTACGYELIELPRAPIEERVRFVLQHASAVGS